MMRICVLKTPHTSWSAFDIKRLLTNPEAAKVIKTNENLMTIPSIYSPVSGSLGLGSRTMKDVYPIDELSSVRLLSLSRSKSFSLISSEMASLPKLLNEML